MAEKKILMIDDPDLVEEIAVTVWQKKGGDRDLNNGHPIYFITEDGARNKYCTHKICSIEGCNNICSKFSSICDECTNKKRWERYRSRPVVQWDGSTPIYDDSSDRWFGGMEEVLEYCEEEEAELSSMQLRDSEPHYLRQIDGGDHWYDDFPAEQDDCELPPAVQSALDALNKAIAVSPPTCYDVGPNAIDISEYLKGGSTDE